LIALVGIALAVGGLYTLNRIVRQSLAPLPAPTPQPEITTKAVVATHDLPLGSVLRSGDVKIVDVPVELAPQGVISDMEQVIGRIIKVSLVTGEMIMDHNLADPTNVNHDIGFVIGDNQVLRAFPAQDLMSSVSVLQRGDLIDVFVSMTVAGQAPQEEGVVAESEVIPGMLTFDAFQRTEITAIVVDIIQQNEQPAAQLPSVQGTPQPQPTPQPSQIRTRAYLLALSAQDALMLKHLKDTGAVFDFVLRSPTSNQLFDLQPVYSDYLIDRYELVIPKQ
jgi:Flp pilus assembly protein CpaB